MIPAASVTRLGPMCGGCGREVAPGPAGAVIVAATCAGCASRWPHAIVNGRRIMRGLRVASSRAGRRKALAWYRTKLVRLPRRPKAAPRPVFRRAAA